MFANQLLLMILRTFNEGTRSLGAGLAIAGVFLLSSCGSQPDVKPEIQVSADSLHKLVDGDPPVKPSGPGGGG